MSRAHTRALIEERRRKVAANVTAGLNFRDIADALGCSLGTVSSDWNAVLASWRKDQVSTAAARIAVELRRYDQLHNALWPSALGGDQGSIDRLLKISKARRELLGMDAPSSLTLEVIQRAAQLAGKMSDEELSAVAFGGDRDAAGAAGAGASGFDEALGRIYEEPEA